MTEKHYQILVNPFPILPEHFTIPARRHSPQSVYSHFATMRRLAWNMPNHIVFYNGPQCGASCPDHMHLQAGSRGLVPLERDWTIYENDLEKLYPLTGAETANMEESGNVGDRCGLYLLKSFVCPVFVIRSLPSESDSILCQRLYKALPVVEGETEPRMNLICWRQENGVGKPDEIVTLLFPRSKHRPDCYYAEGEEKLMISPGALDMGGLLITPREEDFRRITAEWASDILKEVTLSLEQLEPVIAQVTDNPVCKCSEDSPKKESLEMMGIEPQVSVGIMSSPSIRFTICGKYVAKGESVCGEQFVEIQEGGIKWNDSIYRELTFRPEEEGSSFTLHDVTIGVKFHWERQESETFTGTLRFVVDEDKIVTINQLPIDA